MKQEHIRQIWDDYNEAIMARDVASVLAFYTPEIVYDESPMMMSSALHGPEAVCKYWTKVFRAFSSIEITTTNFTASGDRAWVEWTMNNHHCDTNTDIGISGALVVTMSGTKISSEKLFWDSSKLMHDLGAWNRLAQAGVGMRVLKSKLRRWLVRGLKARDSQRAESSLPKS